MAMAFAEVALRIPSCPLAPSVRTALFQCYESDYQDENVDFGSRLLGINLPKPRADLTCSWNGYRWHHHGDHFGYRNPQSPAQADIVLLGDSMTYGHGVEETSTAAHFLRENLGRRVVNLGTTGDCPVQYLARLRNYALPLHPRVVIVFFFENDLQDILNYRPADAIRKFVATGEGPEAGIYPREMLAADFQPPPQPLGQAITEHLLTFRALRALIGRKTDSTLAWPGEPFAVVPPLGEDVPLQGDEELAVEYLRAATAMMATSARDAGARLVFTTIPALDSGRLLQVVRETVRAAADAAGVSFFDLVDAFAVDGRIERGDFFLPVDGHLSEAGHRRVAEAVAKYVREQRLLDSP